jgi:hypothetical protein
MVGGQQYLRSVAIQPSAQARPERFFLGYGMPSNHLQMVKVSQTMSWDTRTRQDPNEHSHTEKLPRIWYTPSENFSEHTVVYQFAYLSPAALVHRALLSKV